MDTFESDKIPVELAIRMNGSELRCYECGAVLKCKLDHEPIRYVEMNFEVVKRPRKGAK